MRYQSLFAPLALAAVMTSTLRGQEVPRVTTVPCELANVEGEAVCGTLTVWEDREARAGRTLDLYFVVLAPTGSSPKPDPIYVLTGGPGSAATGSARGWMRSPHREHRAIVLMDQRGTGRSNVLECLFRDDAPVEVYLGQIFDPDHIAECADALAPHADLSRYTSPLSLDDMDDLREALGHDRINLWGSSYGTRASLVYLRRHEPHVRSAILNASMSLRQTMPIGMARDAEAAIRNVMRDCAEMLDCAAAYPSLEEDYRAAVAGAREPVQVTVRDPRDGETVRAIMQPAGFAEALRAMMYEAGATRSIPRLLHLAAARGDYDGFAQFGAARAYNIGRLAATGMYLSVTCAEDVPFADEAGEYEQGSGTFLADARARSHFDACRRWPAGSVGEGFHENVVSDVPVLILNGTHDPVTPPHWGEDAARTLPNSVLVVVPHGHHGWGGLENAGPCVTSIQTAFLSDPWQKPDLACLATIRRRPFND